MNKPRKYALFAGTMYYPAGGWCDFKGYFTSREDALIYMLNEGATFDWAHLVQGSEIVWRLNKPLA